LDAEGQLPTSVKGHVAQSTGRDNQTHEVIVDAGNAMVLTQGATTRGDSDSGN
jgi:Icc-related predicted phosphoesterase